MDILSVAKMLLGITDTSQDELLHLVIEGVTAKALAYCKLGALPEGLKYTVAEMAAKAYKGMSATDVSSVKRGDVTVSYHAKAASDIVSEYKNVLNSFRRMKNNVEVRDCVR